MTTTQLLERCCRQPDAHLALESYFQFQAYRLGYESHGRSMGGTFPQDDNFLAALRDDYGIHDLPSHAKPWSVLTAIHGPEKGLRKYLEYWQRLARPTAPGEGLFFSFEDLFKALGPEGNMRQRTAMYFDGDASSAHLWSFFSGKSWAERDAGKPGAGKAFTEGFQQWINIRHPFSHSMPWGRTLMFLALGYAQRSLDFFFESFDLFQQGKTPDSTST